MSNLYIPAYLYNGEQQMDGENLNMDNDKPQVYSGKPNHNLAVALFSFAVGAIATSVFSNPKYQRAIAEQVAKYAKNTKTSHKRKA